MAQQLVCLAPQVRFSFALQAKPLAAPGRGQVLLRVHATSVNPIDAKRATGYGKRVLALKGAASFPLVLGNDVAGVVQAVGPGSAPWQPGDHVYGLVPTGPQGAHASHVLVKAAHLRAMPTQALSAEMATLPYTFTTLWLSLQQVGLHAGNAKGKRVLVHGASGGLGQLALQVLNRWGANVTAVCSTPHVRMCLGLGAQAVLDRRVQTLLELPREFDATLNFAVWQDEATLISRLKSGALGHATTVHPLLFSFDEWGWLKGGMQAYRAWSGMRQQARAVGPHTRYGWVVFRPSEAALDAMHGFQSGKGLRLPIGVSVPMSAWKVAFDHVTAQGPGRAILLPEPI